MSIMFCRGCSAAGYYEARYMNYDTRQIQSGWHLPVTPAACKLQICRLRACSTLQSGTGLLPLVLMKTEILTTQTWPSTTQIWDDALTCQSQATLSNTNVLLPIQSRPRIRQRPTTNNVGESLSMFTKFKLQVHMYVLVLYKGIECRNTVKVRIKLLVIKLFLLMEGKWNRWYYFPVFWKQ